MHTRELGVESAFVLGAETEWVQACCVCVCVCVCVCIGLRALVGVEVLCVEKTGPDVAGGPLKGLVNPHTFFTHRMTQLSFHTNLQLGG